MTAKAFGPIQTQHPQNDVVDCWVEETLRFIPPSIWVAYYEERYSEPELPSAGSKSTKTLTPKDAAEGLLRQEAADWMASNNVEFPSELVQYIPGQKPTRKKIVVYNDFNDAKSWFVVPENCPCWDLEPDREWGIEEYPISETLRTVYRLPDARWIVVEECCHSEAPCSANPTFQEISNTQAAELLLLNDHDVPAELKHLVKHRLFESDEVEKAATAGKPECPGPQPPEDVPPLSPLLPPPEPAVDLKSPPGSIQKSANEQSEPDPPHPDGPEPPHWLWWKNTQHRIGERRSRRAWELLNYLWPCQSAVSFEDLQGPGKPWLDPVLDNAITSAVNRLNTSLPPGFPWKLATKNRYVFKEFRQENEP